MSVIPVAYEDFQAANQAFVADGGPWKVSFARPEDYASCPLTKESWCDPGGYCLQCTVLPPDVAARYEITYSANISVNMAQYGGATALEFSWEFWPVYLGSNITAGSEFPIYSKVNGVGYEDTQIAQDFQRFFLAHSWGSTPKVSHTGTMSVTRGGSDGARAYIPLTIKYSFSPGGHTEYFNHYIKGIAFHITTPTNTSLPSTSTLSPNTSPSAPQSKITSGAVVGAVLGSIVFLFLVIGLVFYLRRRSRHSAPSSQEAGASGIFLLKNVSRTSDVDLTRWDTVRSSWLPVPYSIPTPISPPRITSLKYSGVRDGGRATSISGTSSAPPTSDAGSAPPTYDSVPPYVTPSYSRPTTSTSTALAAFANSHRDLISEDLEARLADAGYVPTDNPDDLSEAEWKSLHNVTKLELIRLRTLYNSDRPRTRARK